MSDWADRAGHEPAGIHLLNNHCYRNVTFAGLLHLPKFMALLENHSAQCDHYNRAVLCVPCILARLVKPYWESHPEHLTENEDPLRTVTGRIDNFNGRMEGYRNRDLSADPPLTDEQKENLRKFKQLIPRLARVPFRGADWATQQQDAGEFVNWIIHNIRIRQDRIATNPTFDDLFTLESRGTWTCQICRTEHQRGIRADRTVGVVPIGALHAVSGVQQDLVPLLKQLHKSWFQSKMEIRCQTCKDSKAKLTQNQINQERLVGARISRAPEYLMYQVFSATTIGRRAVKCSQRIRIPLWLDLTKYKEKSFDAPRNHLRYKLCTTMYHSGGAGVGHYYGVYAGPNGVRIIDDTHVWPTNPEDLCTRPKGGTAFVAGHTTDEHGRLKKYHENRGATPYLVIYKRFQPVPKESKPKEQSTSLAAGPGGGNDVDRPTQNAEKNVNDQGSTKKTSKASTTKRTSPSGPSKDTSDAHADYRRSKRLKTKK